MLTTKKLTIGVAVAAFAVCALPLTGSATLRNSPATLHYAPNEECWSHQSGQMTNICPTNQYIYLPSVTDDVDYDTGWSEVEVWTPSVNGVAQSIACAEFGLRYDSTSYYTSGPSYSAGPGYSYIYMTSTYVPDFGTLFHRCLVPPNGKVSGHKYNT